MTDIKTIGKPKLQLVKDNPAVAAALSKAVKAHFTSGFDISKKNSYYGTNQGKIRQISERQKIRAAENENILEIFPDILLAEQIMLSCILSPKDMFTGNFIYQTIADIVPQTIQAQINNEIKSQLESHYNFASELPDIIRAALFRTGSYVSAVIPEAAIDEIINGKSYSMESDQNLIGEIIDKEGRAQSFGLFLGSPDKKKSGTTALESFFGGELPVRHDNHIALEGQLAFNRASNADSKEYKNIGEKEKIFVDGANTSEFLEVTDNYQILKLPALMQAISKQRIKRAIRSPLYTRPETPQPSFATEAAPGVRTPDKSGRPKAMSSDEFKSLVYKDIAPGTDQFMVFPGKHSQKRYSIGRPLRMRIPSEATIPVYPPGDPKNHRGYFVLVDADGNWVTRSSVDASYSGLASLVGSAGGMSGSLTTSMLQKAKTSVSEAGSTMFIDNMLEIYSSIVENDLLNRIRNGVYGAEMVIGKDKEWDRVMLARALAGKMTRMVYVPNEFITYYAYDYHENGIGKSMLDKIKMLTSIRAMLLFSEIMAQLKNAINVTKVSMTLDEQDPDPEKTIEMAANDIMKLRGSYFPLGVNDPNELYDWIQRAGLMFEFSEHPGLPNTKFDFSNLNMQHQVPNKETSDELRKQTFMTFGLTPELVDQAFGPDFATTAVFNNAMFAKRISLLSDETASMMTDDIRNVCSNDTIIMSAIMKILKDGGENTFKNLTESEKADRARNPDQFMRYFVEQVIANIWVDLPKPDIASNDIKAEDFTKKSEMVDKVLESFISQDVFPASFSGDFSTHADELRKIWKHMIMRKWVTEEGFLPEISEIFKRDDNGNPSNDILDMMTAYTKDVMLPAMKFMQKMKTVSKATDKDLAGLNVGEGAVASPSDSNTSDSDESTSDEADDGSVNTGIFDIGDTGTANPDSAGETAEVTGNDNPPETPPTPDSPEGETQPEAP